MKSFSKLPRHYMFATCCFNNFIVFGGFEYFPTFFQRVMQITKTNPSRYNSNCSLLREKLLLQQSVFTDHISISKFYGLGHLKIYCVTDNQQLFQKIVETLRLSPRSTSINFSLIFVNFGVLHLVALPCHGKPT